MSDARRVDGRPIDGRAGDARLIYGRPVDGRAGEARLVDLSALMQSICINGEGASRRRSATSAGRD